jgi:hypothetical protein
MIYKRIEKHNLTFDEIQNWKYCGGNQGSHYNYFKLCFPGKDLPDHKKQCICDHDIIRKLLYHR